MELEQTTAAMPSVVWSSTRRCTPAICTGRFASAAAEHSLRAELRGGTASRRHAVSPTHLEFARRTVRVLSR